MKKFYNISLEFQQIELIQLPTGEVYETVNLVPQSIIPCYDASWFNDPDHQKYLREDDFAYN